MHFTVIGKPVNMNSVLQPYAVLLLDVKKRSKKNFKNVKKRKKRGKN